MQSTHKISGDAAAGFAAYLTEPTGRGDYYVGGVADGEAGRWQGSPAALGRLGLTPDCRVERDGLVALMAGRDPCGRRVNTGPPAPVENWTAWR
jgi:hypothetical protein